MFLQDAVLKNYRNLMHLDVLSSPEWCNQKTNNMMFLFFSAFPINTDSREWIIDLQMLWKLITRKSKAASKRRQMRDTNPPPTTPPASCIKIPHRPIISLRFLINNINHIYVL